MDVAAPRRGRPPPFASGMLRGKSAVVTGSTSGIPTLVANFVPKGIHVFFQSEKGPIGTEAELAIPAGLSETRTSKARSGDITLSPLREAI